MKLLVSSNKTLIRHHHRTNNKILFNTYLEHRRLQAVVIAATRTAAWATASTRPSASTAAATSPTAAATTATTAASFKNDRPTTRLHRRQLFRRQTFENRPTTGSRILVRGNPITGTEILGLPFDPATNLFFKKDLRRQWSPLKGSFRFEGNKIVYDEKKWIIPNKYWLKTKICFKTKICLKTKEEELRLFACTILTL